MAHRREEDPYVHGTRRRGKKNYATVIQLLAAPGMFLPALIARQNQRVRISPYLAYWVKVSLCWSTLCTIALAACVLGNFFLPLKGAVLIIAVVHVISCIMGALAARFHTPYTYWSIGRLLCEREQYLAYGPQLRSSRLSH